MRLHLVFGVIGHLLLLFAPAFLPPLALAFLQGHYDTAGYFAIALALTAAVGWGFARRNTPYLLVGTGAVVLDVIAYLVRHGLERDFAARLRREAGIGRRAIDASVAVQRECISAGHQAPPLATLVIERKVASDQHVGAVLRAQQREDRGLLAVMARAVAEKEGEEKAGRVAGWRQSGDRAALPGPHPRGIGRDLQRAAHGRLGSQGTALLRALQDPDVEGRAGPGGGARRTRAAQPDNTAHKSTRPASDEDVDLKDMRCSDHS